LSSPKDTPQIRVLMVGLDPVCRTHVGQLFSPEQIYDAPYDIEKFMETTYEIEPCVLLFGAAPEGISLIEVAQIARMQYQNQAIFYLTSSRTNFDRKIFVKNGFTDAFLIPIDADVLAQMVRAEITKATNGAVKSFKTVSLIDLQDGQALDFDTYIYMPANRKHVKYSAEGDEIDTERLHKLKKHNTNSMHITTDQVKKFYDFTAKQLRGIQNGTGISETERKEKMASSVRSLMSGMFNDNSSDASIDSGRAIVSDCQQIVKSYILGSGDKNSWYAKLLAATGAESGSYNHAGNVSTFGALFSMAAGLGKPEDIALAGLLHDMGLADLPPDLVGKDEKSRTREEQETYKKHVENTLNIIKFKKMILPEIVVKAISQHHECYSGTGYPKGHAGSRICIEAQLLALADEFDYLTMTRDGQVRMSPVEAFKKIYADNLNNPSVAKFDLELLKKFLTLFPEENKTS
jgi:HD-GYP domain-containing protein (c-di-GMP phosphodiesterase class II)